MVPFEFVFLSYRRTGEEDQRRRVDAHGVGQTTHLGADVHAAHHLLQRRHVEHAFQLQRLVQRPVQMALPKKKDKGNHFTFSSLIVRVEGGGGWVGGGVVGPDDVGDGDDVVLDDAVRVELRQRQDPVDEVVHLLLLQVAAGVVAQILQNLRPKRIPIDQSIDRASVDVAPSRN